MNMLKCMYKRTGMISVIIKRIVFMLVTVVIIMSSSSVYAGGGGGLGGGATEFTQLLNNSELMAQVGQLSSQINNQITQITNQVTQITNQITMIQDMILNTARLPQQLFGDVTQIYSRIKGVMNQTKGIAYSMANLDEEMKRKFNSYTSMSNLSTAVDFQKEHRKIVDTQMETARTTMESLGVAWEQLENDDTEALRKLQQIAQTANGRNQIAQSTNQLLGFLGEDSIKLRQLIMMQTQMTTIALEAERAEQDAGQKRHEESLNISKPMFEGFENFELKPLGKE